MDAETRLLLEAVYAGKIKHKGNALHIRIEAMRQGIAEMEWVLDVGIEGLRKGREVLAILEAAEQSNQPF